MQAAGVTGEGRKREYWREKGGRKRREGRKQGERRDGEKKKGPEEEKEDRAPFGQK